MHRKLPWRNPRDVGASVGPVIVPLATATVGTTTRDLLRRTTKRSNTAAAYLVYTYLALALCACSMSFRFVRNVLSEQDVKQTGVALPYFNLAFNLHLNVKTTKHPRVETNLPSGVTSNGRRPIVRYDRAGNFTIVLERSHALPHAVPEQRQIPPAFSEDWEYHFRQRTNTTTTAYGGLSARRAKDYNWNHNYSSDYRTLYLANPSILPLHNTAPKSGHDKSSDNHFLDPDWLSPQDLHDLTGGDPKVRYVATFRAYTGCNCFGADPLRRLWKAGELLTYLGLALLDENLDVVEDVLIDLNAGPGYGRYWLQVVGDCRIFLLRGGLYLLCNEKMFRINIRRKIKSDNINRHNHATGQDVSRLPYVYPNIYGGNLEVTLLFSRHRWAGKNIGGKNWNIFRAPSTSNSSTGPYDYFLQVYPLQPHWYHRLNVPEASAMELPSQLYREEEDYQWYADASHPLPKPSFDTPDSERLLTVCRDNGNNCSIVPFWGDEDRGSACCVSMQLPNVHDGDNTVLVGITHSKFTKEHLGWARYGDEEHHKINQYVSRFVAYESRFPFRVVARSGWFCLGFANPNTDGNINTANTLAGRNTQYRLEIFNETYHCPFIHFVTSFAEVVGDASKVIIGYGVNDCHPRMIVVEKSEIIERLLG